MKHRLFIFQNLNVKPLLFILLTLMLGSCSDNDDDTPTTPIPVPTPEVTSRTVNFTLDAQEQPLESSDSIVVSRAASVYDLSVGDYSYEINNNGYFQCFLSYG